MISKSGSVIDKLIRGYLHPVLKEKNFIRKERTWNRDARGFKDVIDVQASRWNEGESVSFTINLGVFVPSVYSICWGVDAPSFVKESDCIVRIRLGALLNDAPKDKKRDHWWDSNSSTDFEVSTSSTPNPADMETVGREVAKVIATRGISFLEQFDSLTAIHDFLIQDTGWEVRTPLGRIYLAIIKAQLGDLMGARQLLAELNTEKNRSWRERVFEVAGRLGSKLEWV